MLFLHCWISNIFLFHSQPCSSCLLVSPWWSWLHRYSPAFTPLFTEDSHMCFMLFLCITSSCPFPYLLIPAPSATSNSASASSTQQDSHNFNRNPIQESQILNRNPIISLGFSFLYHGWKIIPKQRTKWSRVHFVSFSSLRGHSLFFPPHERGTDFNHKKIFLVFFLPVYWELIDVHHCTCLRYAVRWFDLRIF